MTTDIDHMERKSATLKIGNCILQNIDMFDGRFPFKGGIENQFNNEIPELVVTDIPYGQLNDLSGNVRERYKGPLRVNSRGAADVIDFELKQFVDFLVDRFKGSAYVFCSTEQVSELRKLFTSHGITTRLCIWEKTNPSPANGEHLWLSGVETCIYARKKGAVFNQHCKNTVWRFPCGRREIHPTQKPVELMKFLIESSSNAGDLVYDPCFGSASTAIACMDAGRYFFGSERSGEYFDSAVKRLEQHEIELKNKPATLI